MGFKTLKREISMRDKEIWKQVKGYEGVYSVSNKGRVRSDRKCTNTSKGKIIKYSLNGRGYPSVSLCKNNIKKTKKLSHIVTEAFIGKRPEKLQVNHIDGNVLNSHIRNLEYVTQAENTQHAYDNNLIKHPTGEDWHNTKLKKDQVFRIRKMYKDGVLSQYKIAKMFNVTQTCISLIIRRVNLAHLK
jgi:predicted XRE-type DNA-binding protein